MVNGSWFRVLVQGSGFRVLSLVRDSEPAAWWLRSLGWRDVRDLEARDHR